MKILRLLFAAILLGSSLARAQVAGSAITGLSRITLPGLSDTVLACPFARPAAATGEVLSATGNVVTFKGPTGWTANQFVNGGTVTDHFYLLVQSGPKEGAAYAITANDSNTMTLDLDGDTLTSLAADDRLSIIPHWTLATLFPDGAACTSRRSRATGNPRVLFPNVNATGINANPSRTFISGMEAGAKSAKATRFAMTRLFTPTPTSSSGTTSPRPPSSSASARWSRET